MQGWAKTIFVLGVFWLLTRWIGAGSFLPVDIRSAALWAAVLLAFFLLWRDGRALLARLGLSRPEAPLSILEQRLARGELDLDAYRKLRDELLRSAGIPGRNKNTKPRRVSRDKHLS